MTNNGLEYEQVKETFDGILTALKEGKLHALVVKYAMVMEEEQQIALVSRVGGCANCCEELDAANIDDDIIDARHRLN